MSRIIRETEISRTEITKKIIQSIKKLLIETSKSKTQPDISFEIEEGAINLPFDRRLSYEQSEEITYDNKPELSGTSFDNLSRFGKLYNPYLIDKDVLRKRVENVLSKKSQATLTEIIDSQDGLSKGLTEFFGYVSILKEYKHTVNEDKQQPVVFDRENKKSILIPEIILTK